MHGTCGIDGSQCRRSHVHNILLCFRKSSPFAHYKAHLDISCIQNIHNNLGINTHKPHQSVNRRHRLWFFWSFIVMRLHIIVCEVIYLNENFKNAIRALANRSLHSEQTSSWATSQFKVSILVTSLWIAFKESGKNFNCDPQQSIQKKIQELLQTFDC